MAVITVYGKTPDVGSAAFVAPNATLAGDVVLAAGSSVWYGAVVRGDTGAIRIGKNSNIQDNSVVHVIRDVPTLIGDHVAVGHGVVIHSATIEENCLIGMGAVILDQAVIGHGSIVAAGAVVSPRTVIPPHSLVMGVPGKPVKTLDPSTEEARIKHALTYAALAGDYLQEDYCKTE